MTWTVLDTWIVVTGALAALSCALLGSFLVLRRMSMMGDAISHAVLPGLAIAFLLTGDRSDFTMFVGAAVVGVLTAVFTEWLSKLGKVDEGASMGVVFTALFAAGLVLIVRGADAVDLDPGCVLYGAIELVPLDLLAIGPFSIPRAVRDLATVLLINAVFVLLFFKELRITSFDPSLATTLGINARLVHYALMGLVAVTTVAAFESVGSILVIAMLIAPAAAAHLLTDRLAPMIVIACFLAALSAVLGHWSAITVPTWCGYSDTTTGGMIAVASGVLFALSVLLAPRHGIVSKWIHQIRLSLRIAREDVLGLLYRLREIGADVDPVRVVRTMREAIGWSPWISRFAFRQLVHRGQVRRQQGAFGLTASGVTAAARLIRTHRIWESYATRHLNQPVDHAHLSAERMEHFVSEPMEAEMEEECGAPRTDPHGRMIPEIEKREQVGELGRPGDVHR